MLTAATSPTAKHERGNKIHKMEILRSALLSPMPCLASCQSGEGRTAARQGTATHRSAPHPHGMRALYREVGVGGGYVQSLLSYHDSTPRAPGVG